MNGLLLINKPLGLTAFDCIRHLRPRIGIKKIGHAGTLDPLATGLMLMLVGAATKQAARFSQLDKTYVAEISLGATSPTGDQEGPLTTTSRHRPTLEAVSQALNRLIGQITQTPPIYSAIKIKGTEAYKLARRGQVPTMPQRLVNIQELTLLDYRFPKLTVKVSCSSGTYVRSLAEEIGRQLGTGAYLSALIRTRVGQYHLDQAVALDKAKPLDVIAID